MKLKKIRLKNFRSYSEETEVDVDDLNVLIGKNDVGKSELSTTPSTKGAMKVKIGGAKKKAKTEDLNEVQVVENSPANSALKPVKQSSTPLKTEIEANQKTWE